MTQEERLDALLALLLQERPEYAALTLPESPGEKRRLFRSLVNVRPPEPVSERFLALQDAFLQEETRRKGVTGLRDLTPVGPGLYLWQGDITALRCDAIVNAANSRLLGCFVPCHGCIDNAIHTFAGVQLRLDCAGQMRRQGHGEPTGRAKITKAYNLPCRYVLHTVGPVIRGGGHRPRPGGAGLLLPRLPGPGGGKRPAQRGVLLHFHRGVPLPAAAGRRRGPGRRPYLAADPFFFHRGDLQCF